MKLRGNKILLTGGASGIGLELAERFAREQNTVIICGRRESALAAAKERIPSLVTRASDLSMKQGRDELLAWIRAEHPDTNVLINNAGIQNWMNVTDSDFMDRAQAELAINVEAPLHLVASFLKLEALDTIVNVTSGLSFVPLVKVPVYCATQAFLHSFTLSLRELCKPRGIEVVELIPPALNTDLGGKGRHDAAPPVADFVAATFQQLEAGKDTVTFGFSERVAGAGQDVLGAVFARMNGQA
jgi:uncharacterized oxidoreductase